MAVAPMTAMTLNPLPFVFAPGLAAVGYVFGGVAGAVAALLAWGVIVVMATACALLMRNIRRASLRRFDAECDGRGRSDADPAQR